MVELPDEDIGYAELATLKLLALAGAVDGDAKISCAGLASKLDASNQTASRRLQRLEDADLLAREIVSDGQWVRVTDDGERLLQEEYAEYQRIFEHGIGVTLSGAVESGMGEGRHYVSLSGYHEQFVQKLGYEPYPGTFNLQLDDRSTRARARMNALDPIEIEGWEDGDRTYGPAYCYPITLESKTATYEDAHVISPERTHYGDAELEIIAPDQLRVALDVEDDDVVTVHVHER
jgi:riboflavin kinase